jgi:hypothetical protein
VSAHNQFIRKVKLIVGNDTDGIDLSNLQIVFSITQAETETPQTASIKIYNMAPETVQKIKLKAYARVILEAGYQHGSYGIIFDGEIVRARLGRESAVDTYLDILAAEGFSSNQAVINQTLAAGATLQDTADAAAGPTGRSIKYYHYSATAKLPRGQALYGMSRDVLHQTAATAGCSYRYEKGQISWVPLEGFKDNEFVVLNSATGMIGWPEQTEEGVSVRCLMNPLLDVGSRLKIDNASVIASAYATDIHFIAGNIPALNADGMYRIYRIEHHGNTRGTEWFSDIIALSIDEADARLTTLVQKGQY